MVALIYFLKVFFKMNKELEYFKNILIGLDFNDALNLVESQGYKFYIAEQNLAKFPIETKEEFRVQVIVNNTTVTDVKEIG